MDYIDRYKIGPDKLKQQYIDPDVASMTVANFSEWLAKRAQLLADASNEFLGALKARIDTED